MGEMSFTLFFDGASGYEKLKINTDSWRDEETKRPRVNKLDSQLDRTQKSEGEYYYSVEK